jgi:hypothetical protein
VFRRRVQPQRTSRSGRVRAKHLGAPDDDLEVDAGTVLPHALRRREELDGELRVLAAESGHRGGEEDGGEGIRGGDAHHAVHGVGVLSLDQFAHGCLDALGDRDGTPAEEVTSHPPVVRTRTRPPIDSSAAMRRDTVE